MIKGCMAVYPERGDPTKVEWSAHYSRWVPLLNSAPAYDAFKYPDIEMDFTGLSDKEDFKFLNKYDFVFLYIHPVDKVGKYWWYDIINEVGNSYKGKIILQFDYEGIMKELPPYIRTLIDCSVDVLCYNSPTTAKWDLNIPKYPLMMLQPVEELEKRVTPLPKSMRSGVGILWHAGTNCNIQSSLALCRDKGWILNVFTAWLGMTCEDLEKYCRDILGVCSVNYYSFMEYKDFLKLLRNCYVVLEDNVNYYGFSRLSYECATLRIPIVGSTNSMGCNLAYPYTTTNPQNLQFQTQLIKRLFDDDEFYGKVTDYAYNTMKEYFSDKSRLNDFTNILNGLGFNV